MIRVLVNNVWETFPEESLQIGADTFAFQTGLYETFRTLDWKPIFLEPHLIRLFQSAKNIGLEIQYSHNELLSMIAKVISNFDDPNQRVRILAVPENLIVYTSPLSLDPVIYDGVSAITMCANRETPNVKTTNYKVCYDAWKQAEKLNCFEAILMDESGHVFEGSRSNIFWVKNRQLFTRESGVLPGVTRQIVLRRSPIDVVFGSLNQSEFDSLDELFLTNSGSGIVPITSVNSNQIVNGDVGPISTELMKCYEKWIIENSEE